MASITVDGKEYDMDQLNDNAKMQLANLQFVQAEIKRLEANLAVFKTAASTYSSALKNALEA